MCGRFTLTRSAAEVAEHFGVSAAPALAARFNVAPTQPVLAVRAREGGGREAVQLQWGLVPFWAKHPQDAAKHINARVETLAQFAQDADPAHRWLRGCVRDACVQDVAGN